MVGPLFIRVNYMRHASKGFTLIEVMIVVVIIGILASIAYPSYQEYVRRTNRAEGQAFLQDLAARQERYFSQNNSYITAVSDIDKLGRKSSSETGKYALTINNTDSYTLTATPNFDDPKCGKLSLNALGAKTAEKGSINDCWR